MNSSKQFLVNKRQLRRHFDLSRNKSLRTLETTAESIISAKDTAFGFLESVLSSIPPPVPLDIVILYRDHDLGARLDCELCKPTKPVCFGHSFPRQWDFYAQCCRQTLKVFREMHSVRDFRLILCADVFDCVGGGAIYILEGIVREDEANGGLNHPAHKPMIISERRTLRTRTADDRVGSSSRWAVFTSAL